MNKLTRNRIQCGECGDVIESTLRHNLVWCDCKGLFVDGGLDYQRWGGNQWEKMIDLTEEVTGGPR